MLPDLLHSQARTQPDAIAVLHPAGAVTFAGMDALVQRAKAGLRQTGVQPGDYVALRAEPDLAFIALLWACFRCGAVACPLSTRLPEETLAQYLDFLQPRLFIPKVSDAFFADPAAEEIVAFPDDQPVLAVFTSGSTGAPKAAVLSYGNLYWNALGSNQNIPLDPGDRWLLSLPLYHVGGLAVLFRCFLSGATVVLPEAGEQPEAAVARYGITHVSLVATQVQRMLRAGVEATGLKAVLLGGSAIPASVIEEAHRRGWPLFTSYGMTEMASQIATTPPGAPLGALFTSGRVLFHRELNMAADGECCVRGRTRFLGYLQKDQTLRRPFDADGWFRTGDTGFFDAEGWLHVTGRKDNQFISGGENIHPEEIETALLRLPEVARAVVVPVPDAEFGQRPVAFVAWTGEALLLDAVRMRLNPLLPRFKHPVALLPWPQASEVEGLKVRRKAFEERARKEMGG